MISVLVMSVRVTPSHPHPPTTKNQCLWVSYHSKDLMFKCRLLNAQNILKTAREEKGRRAVLYYHTALCKYLCKYV